MVCTAGDITYDADGCVREGVRHKYGDTLYDGCVGVCSCTRDGTITCVSRCPPSGYMYTASSTLGVWQIKKLTDRLHFNNNFQEIAKNAHQSLTMYLRKLKICDVF
uniref:Uncharacterized protein n=1 Tax=Cacopsylla melanoneura TaxID=428564 RepID=A0A8D8QUS1_9HEMI